MITPPALQTFQPYTDKQVRNPETEKCTNRKIVGPRENTPKVFPRKRVETAVDLKSEQEKNTLILSEPQAYTEWKHIRM